MMPWHSLNSTYVLCIVITMPASEWQMQGGIQAVLPPNLSSWGRTDEHTPVYVQLLPRWKRNLAEKEVPLIEYLGVTGVSNFGCLRCFHSSDAAQQRGMIWENVYTLMQAGEIFLEIWFITTFFFLIVATLQISFPIWLCSVSQVSEFTVSSECYQIKTTAKIVEWGEKLW